MNDIKFLPGVGPKRSELFNKELGIYSYEDLLYYYPYKYIDRSRTYTIREINGTMPYIQLRGKIVRYETQGEGYKRRLTAIFADATGTIELVWFKGIEKMKSHFLNSKAVQKIIATLWKVIPRSLPETLPAAVIARAHVIYLSEALYNIHFPQSPDVLRKAQFRLKFEELFYLQLNILRYTRQRMRRLGGFPFGTIGEHFNRFYRECLPFELTGAQKRVLKEIRADVGSGRQMNRLLQGDVGSGKTLVALMAMLMAVDNGYQACMMAPTEILATQHYETLSSLLRPIGVRTELLTGSTRKKQREEIHEGLVSGDVKILVGTHALLEDTVVFSNLGFVVIDEQHRFGVRQRETLAAKGKIRGRPISL